jgi:tetratricopeptide (TPR) repeat protein
MRFSGALGWLLIGLAVTSGCASTYRSGQIALQEGRNLEAVSLFTQVLSEDPTYVDARFALGIADYRGFFDAAIGPLGRTVLAQPDRAEARLYLALTYLALEKQDGATRQLRALLKLNIHPRNAAQVRAALLA